MPCLIFLMPILRIDLLKAQKERFIGTLFTKSIMWSILLQKPQYE